MNEVHVENREIPLVGSSIVFDWGNTLVFDPFDDIKENVARASADLAKNSLGTSFDVQQFLDGWSKSNAEKNFQFASHFSQEEPWIQDGLKSAGVPDHIRPLLGPQVLALYRQQFKQLLESSPRKDELRRTLEELQRRGKHLAVISNDRSFTPKSTLTWLGVEDLFDHFLTSEEIGIEKPDPRVFDVAASRFGKPIGDIIYVGDDPVRDVECSHKAGAQAILYIPPERYRTSKSWRDYANHPDQPDAKVEKFEDLLKVIS